MTALRASRVPLALRCPGSTRETLLALSEETGPAALGTAVHEALRALVERGAVDWDGVPALASFHGVNPDDVFVLCRLATKLWQSLKASFPDALTEVPLSAEVWPGFHLTGTADLLTVSDHAARVADWKTGRVDYDYAGQMRAYAALALMENADIVEATSTIIWVRDNEIENYTMRRSELGVWLADLRTRILAWDGVYHPGKHCTYCPRSHECDARTALVRRDVAALSEGRDVATSLAVMPPDQILELHRRADSVIAVAENVRFAIKSHVEAFGDVVADGQRLTIETQNRRELRAREAWPVLELAGFTSPDLAECIDLHVSRVEKIAARKAGRGKGAAAVRELAEKLETAGAVSVRQSKYLRSKRV